MVLPLSVNPRGSAAASHGQNNTSTLSDAEMALFAAIEEGNYDAVKCIVDEDKAVTERLDINVCHPRRLITPIFAAVDSQYRSPDIVGLLLDNGARIKDELIVCVRKGLSKLLETVLRHPMANIEQSIEYETLDGHSALSLAACGGTMAHLAMVRDLIVLGKANVDYRPELRDGGRGFTPLMRCISQLASKRGHGQRIKYMILECLLEHNADPTILVPMRSASASALGTENDHDVEMVDAFALAAAYGHVDALKLLYEHGHGQGQDRYVGNVERPLYFACRSGNLSCVEFLLRLRQQQHDAHAHGYFNAFDFASVGVEHPVIEAPSLVLKVLLENGMHPDVLGRNGRTRLYRSSVMTINPSLPDVRLLLQFGANPWQLRQVKAKGGVSVDDIAIDEAVKEELDHCIETVWPHRVPSLTDMCCWKLKRMKAIIDQQWFVDNVPDVLCRDYFSDWKGAERWVEAASTLKCLTDCS